MGDSCIYQEYLGSTHLILVKLILKLHCRTLFHDPCQGSISSRVGSTRCKVHHCSVSIFRLFAFVFCHLLGIVALHICAVKKGTGRRCWRRRRLNVENSFLAVVVLLLLQRETGREEVFFWRVQNEWCSGRKRAKWGFHEVVNWDCTVTSLMICPR